MQLNERGLTLVEICITVAIIALGAAIVLPAVGNVTRADLRRSSSAVASKVRESYDNAALSGQTWRMVFVMAPPEKPASNFQVLDKSDDDEKKQRKPGIYIESTERTMAFDAKSGAFVAAADAAELLAELDPPPGEEDKKDKKHSKEKSDEPPEPSAGGALAGLFGINKLAIKTNAKASFKEESTVPLSDTIHVLDVWTEGMDQPVSEGEVYLLFFPNGYTQEAMIHLEDNERRVMTVRVSPLTGKCSILAGYTEAPK